jgi:hypothetical protein
MSCPNCNYKYLNTYDAVNHSINCNGISIDRSSDTSKKAIEGFICGKCGDKYLNTYDVVNHSIKCNGISIDRSSDTSKKAIDRSICGKCGDKFNGESVFNRVEHKCKKEEPEEDIQPLNGKTKNDLQLAMNELTKPKGSKKECPFCLKSFVNLNKHFQNCKKK